MKKLKRLLGFATVLALLFTSCSKEDENVLNNDSDMATLSFGAVLNDLVTNKGALKQAIDGIPECSDEAPAYVEVVLTGPSNVGSMADPVVVSVNPNPGDYDGDGEDEYFTNESADLELQPGEYTLQYFAVYDGDPNVAGSNMIWIAPTAGGDLADFVSTSLPMTFDLGAGVKKYLDVEVLCFDDRLVNEYGYLFFDLETNEAFEFCFFANYCDPSGRHYPAAYSVNVWLGNDSSGTLLHSESNTTGIGNPNDPYNEDDPYAEPLCLALPDLAQFEDDEDYLYYEVTLLDWPEVYGTVPATAPITGNLSRNDIHANFDGADDVDYEHLRFCDEQPVAEECDIEGPDTDCTEVFLGGESEDWVMISADGALPLYVASSTTGPGEVIVNLNEGNPSFAFYTDSENALDDYVIEISQYGPQTEGRLACVSAEDITLEEGDADAVVEFTSDLVYPFYAKIKANVCDVDDDGGEIVDCTFEEPCDLGELSNSAICYYAFLEGANDFVLVQSQEDLILLSDEAGSVQPAEASTSFVNGELTVSISSYLDVVSAYEIEVRPVGDDGNPATDCNDFACSTTIESMDFTVGAFSGDAVTGYPFYIRIQAELCADLPN